MADPIRGQLEEDLRRNQVSRVLDEETATGSLFRVIFSARIPWAGVLRQLCYKLTDAGRHQRIPVIVLRATMRPSPKDLIVISRSDFTDLIGLLPESDALFRKIDAKDRGE